MYQWPEHVCQVCMVFNVKKSCVFIDMTESLLKTVMIENTTNVCRVSLSEIIVKIAPPVYHSSLLCLVERPWAWLKAQCGNLWLHSFLLSLWPELQESLSSERNGWDGNSSEDPVLIWIYCFNGCKWIYCLIAFICSISYRFKLICIFMRNIKVEIQLNACN